MHPATENMLKWLTPNASLPAPQRDIAERCWKLADELIPQCAEGAELTTGLRKLLEAKDCFVRASLEATDA